jgi:glutamine---fructose-6-phosphate transaminase (isomerizing)
MCGIVGYVGDREASKIIVDGLKRLEYRGYDSAGIAVVSRNGLQVRRAAGRIANLETRLRQEPVSASVGIGHTRWATHGRPCEANAHPHTDCTGSLAVVHNGILENHEALRARLVANGHRFRSETDTEVIAHLVEAHLGDGDDVLTAVRGALAEVRGAYAVAIVCRQAPAQIIAARHGAGGVVVGLGQGEMFLASDVPALLPHTREVVVLEDDEVALVSPREVRLLTLAGRSVEREPRHVTWDAESAQKGGYPHFMLKEIYEQPRAVADTFRGWIERDGRGMADAMGLSGSAARGLDRIVLVGCGTSFHAALVGRWMMEALTGLPAEVDLASEFRYRSLALDSETLVVAISQSGETADTLGAVRAARARQARVLGITNVVGSGLTREATGVLYTHAGPEIGVASTKTFTATLTACYLLGLALGLERGHLTEADLGKRIDELREVPKLMEAVLASADTVRVLATELAGERSFLYLGRGVHHAVALEGALKLKELSYLHAEGYAGGEMKHGPIALIDSRVPVIALAPRDAAYDRMLANVEEVRAREGRVIALGSQGDDELARKAFRMLALPPAAELLAPLISVIPLQLLAYHIAVLRGCDVDQPRNLAKSVTVE